MHNQSKIRMSYFESKYIPKEGEIKVLDVGSYDFNGNYKKIFKDKRYEYVGMDMNEGPNVDLVMTNPYDWSCLETDSFDVVISGQTFEHNEFFWLTMGEMARVLKRDGLLCIIVPNSQKEHRYPVDCYRFFSDGMVALARYVGMEVLHADTNCAPTKKQKKWYGKINKDTMLIASKPYSGPTKYVDVLNYSCVPVDQEKTRNGFAPYKRSIIL